MQTKKRRLNRRNLSPAAHAAGASGLCMAKTIPASADTFPEEIHQSLDWQDQLLWKQRHDTILWSRLRVILHPADSEISEEIVSLIGSRLFYLVCPVTYASAEQSFSQLHRLKTNLRGACHRNASTLCWCCQRRPTPINWYSWMRLLVNDFVTRNE